MLVLYRYALRNSILFHYCKDNHFEKLAVQHDELQSNSRHVHGGTLQDCCILTIPNDSIFPIQIKYSRAIALMHILTIKGHQYLLRIFRYFGIIKQESVQNPFQISNFCFILVPRSLQFELWVLWYNISFTSSLCCIFVTTSRVRQFLKFMMTIWVSLIRVRYVVRFGSNWMCTVESWCVVSTQTRARLKFCANRFERWYGQNKRKANERLEIDIDKMLNEHTKLKREEKIRWYGVFEILVMCPKNEWRWNVFKKYVIKR